MLVWGGRKERRIRPLRARVRVKLASYAIDAYLCLMGGGGYSSRLLKIDLELNVNIPIPTVLMPELRCAISSQ